MKNPILFFILVVFTIVNIADGITALFILDGEANPIYLMTGSIWPVVLLKVMLVSLLWFYWYRNIYASNFIYYLITLFSIVGTVMFCFGVYSNVLGILNPELVEIAKDIPDEVKVQAYKTMITWIYIVPMLFCVVSFWVYDKSINKVKIDRKHFKWWKL